MPSHETEGEWHEEPVRKDFHITRAMIKAMGGTPMCKRCDGMARDKQNLAAEHTAECRERFRTELAN